MIIDQILLTDGTVGSASEPELLSPLGNGSIWILSVF